MVLRDSGLGARGSGLGARGLGDSGIRLADPLPDRQQTGAARQEVIGTATFAPVVYGWLWEPRMEHITSFRDLEVWRLAMAVAVECYALTRAFPPEERYGLRRELRRSAVSIPSNIAEGHNRRGRRAYLNHINIALGSQAELESQLELAVRLGFLANGSVRVFQEKLARVGQMLHGLQRSLEARRMRSAIAGTLALLLSAAGTLLWAR